MDNCKTLSAGERTVGEYDLYDPLIQTFMNDFATNDVNFERDNGKIFLCSAIGIFTLILVVLVLVTCLIYACLRCKRHCNTYRWHCEKKYQKCYRWLFNLLMLLILALILYLLAEAIDWTRKCNELEKSYNRYNENSGQSKLRRIENALITDYNNFYENAFRSVDDIVFNSLGSANYDVGSDLDKECGTPITRRKIRNTISNMQIDIDSLCIEIVMWNDLSRAIIRNITSFLAQTEEGRAFYKIAEFVKSDYLGFQTSTLFQMIEFLQLVGTIVNDIEDIYSNSSTQSKEVVKQLLAPYLNDVREDLDGRGETLRALYGSISHGIDDVEVNLRTGDSDGNIYRDIPLWVLIFEWICFVWIILTILILLIALILRCCGKRWSGEKRRNRKKTCCSQECGSCLFQLTVYTMSLLFLLALLPIWWNYEYGAGIYNDRCRKESSKRGRFTRSINNQSVEESPTQSSLNTVDEMSESLPTTLDAFTESVTPVYRNRPVVMPLDIDDDSNVKHSDICWNMQVEAFLASNATKLDNKIVPPDVNKLTKYLQIKLSTMKPTMQKLKQNSKLADELPLTKICNDFKNQIDLTSFVQFHNETYYFVSNEMRNSNRDAELSLCNLNNLKKNFIDRFEKRKISKLVSLIGEQCKVIDQYFNEGVVRGIDKCLTEMEKMYKSSNKNVSQTLSGATNNLDEMFSNGLKNYRSTASEELARASSDSTDQNAECMYYTQCKNGIWIPLLLILLLFLPLIPIAIYLSRLYSCCGAGSSVGRDCCYEARLYDAIKDRLYRKRNEIECQARQRIVPLPCPPNCPQTPDQRQCPPKRQCVSKPQQETELATMIGDQPQLSAHYDSQQQSCSKNMKFRYKIRISFLLKSKSSGLP